MLFLARLLDVRAAIFRHTTRSSQDDDASKARGKNCLCNFYTVLVESVAVRDAKIAEKIDRILINRYTEKKSTDNA